MDFIAAIQSGFQTIPQLNILIVDDDMLNQRMMQLLLTREGHHADLASNGLEALEAVMLQRYDVVFMDLQMPVMDGIEASRRIRSWENGGLHTFIVALTASYLPEQGQVLFQAGIDNYISKPFELEQVQQLLKYGFQALKNNVLREPEVLEVVKSDKVLDIQKGIVQVGGDEDMYRDLLDDFIKGLPSRVQNIQHFFANKDMDGLSRAAHNLQGVSANLGAEELSIYVGKVDQHSAEGDTESLDSLIREIPLAVVRLLDISNTFLAEKKNKLETI